MNEAVIVSTARTAIGTAGRGSLMDVDALELGTKAVAEAVERSGIDPQIIDDVVLGEALYGGGDIARYAAIEAGMPHVAGVAHNRHCASGLAAVRAWASAGVPPADTGLAPTVAIPKVLERAGLTIDDIDLWEINEAFASMCVATTRILGIDEDIVNVQGSGCSLGHPIAMTGGRMVISLLHDLRRRGGGTGIAAMCAGGGMSSAVVLDVPAPA